MSDDNNKEFEVETPLGKLKAKGYHLGNVLQMIIAALIGVGVYAIINMQTEAKATWSEMTRAAKAEHAALSVSIDRQTEVQEEMNFILTLTPEERTRLNLSMPKSLRDKLRRVDR